MPTPNPILPLTLAYQVLLHYADPNTYRTEPQVDDLTGLANQTAAVLKAAYVPDESLEIVEQVYRTLQYYGNLTTSQAPRIGGVVQGCPRGPRPTPKDLALDARVVARRLRSAYPELN